MADEKGGDDNGGLHLRVDRLAAAMEAARARARAEAEGVPPRDRPSGRRAAPPGGADGTRSGASAPDDPPGVVEPGPDAGPPRRVDTVSTVGEEASPLATAMPETGPDQRDDPVPMPAPSRDDTARGKAAAPVGASPDAAPHVPPLLLTPDLQPRAPGAESADDPAVARGSLIPSAPAAPAPVADPAMAAALLAVQGVATDIGRYRILQDVTFDVPRGAVTMLLGRNGAGKTTTLRTIMGLWRARAGEIVFAGDRIDRWSTHRIARAGIGYVPESMSIFGDLTVAENVALGARSGPVARDRLDWLTGLFPPLGTFWRSPAGNLSGGQKQMLALARALVERRRLYLIDEPTKGLAPVIVDTVVAALRDLKLQGATILMVEQNFAVARALGDACAVIDDGRVVWSGTMAALADDPALQARLMGLDLGDAA